MLKYTLYAWREEQFRSWKGEMDARWPGQGVYGPQSAEMYDVSEEAVKEQLAEWFDCTPDEIHLPTDGQKMENVDILPGEGYEYTRAFGLTFWDVAYPNGIGSYLVGLNHLGDE